MDAHEHLKPSSPHTQPSLPPDAPARPHPSSEFKDRGCLINAAARAEAEVPSFFGNGLRTLAAVALAGAVIGLFVVVASVIGIAAEGRWDRARPIYLLILFFTLPTVLVLFVLPTTASGVCVTGDKVQHLLFKKIVLSEYPIRDFMGMHLGGGGPILTFRGKRRMRLIGMHLRNLAALEALLRRRCRELGGSVDDPMLPGDA